MTRLPITVVIPCLNEEETLSRAIQEAFAGLALAGVRGEVIVADNGSTDSSRRIALEAGARVVSATPRGYGAALHAGIQAASHPIVAFADADLSYSFLGIGCLVEPLQRNRAEFVLGTRLRGEIESGAMPFLNRYLGTPALSALIRWLHHLPTTDCNSGMRAFRRDAYDRLGLAAPGMEYASEMLIRVARAGLRYAEVPIRFRRDLRNRAPHLRRWRDGMRHLRCILDGARAGPGARSWLLPGIGAASAIIAFIVRGMR